MTVAVFQINLAGLGIGVKASRLERVNDGQGLRAARPGELADRLFGGRERSAREIADGVLNDPADAGHGASANQIRARVAARIVRRRGARGTDGETDITRTSRQGNGSGGTTGGDSGKANGEKMRRMWCGM
jgi:hypothetical protein